MSTNSVHLGLGVIGSALSLAVASAGVSQYTAFSCDSSNGSIGGNVFSAVSFPTVRGASCPNGAGPDADPLGPCFTQRTTVKAGLDGVPAGSRALTLESGPGMYYLFDANASVNRWGGMKDMYYMDTLAGPGKVQGPWADVWSAAIRKRFDQWFGDFKAIGGEVDLVLCDFEMGDHSSSYDWSHQPTADGSDPVDALLADPRWPALQARLTAAGQPYGVSFDEASIREMKDWTSRDWRMHVWGHVVTSLGVASLLNASVYQPIAAHFPNVRFSNFAHGHHTDPSGVESPSSKSGLWPYAAGAIGLGAHVGTHQSRGFYGGTNTTRVLASQRPGPGATQTELAGNSFDSLLLSVLVGRDMAAAAPDVPVHPWLAPKYADWGSGWSYLSSGNQTTDEVFMWEENVFHLALATATAEFLWWQPGSQKPMGIGQPLLSKTLKELDWVTGLADHGQSGCTLTPLATNLTGIANWAPTYILTGMEVRCNDGFTRSVFRFTPRCTQTVWCTWWGAEYPPKNGTVSPDWRIGSGWNLTPVPGGTVLLAEDPVSTAGAWLIR